MRLALEPILNSLYAIPKIALLPLVMLVLGVNERTLIFTSTLTSFVQMTVSTTGGVLAVDRSILEAGKNYGATGWRLFRYVLFPSALPDDLHGHAHRTGSHFGARDRRRADRGAGRSRRLHLDRGPDLFREKFILGLRRDRRPRLDSQLRARAHRAVAYALAAAVERCYVPVTV